MHSTSISVFERRHLHAPQPAQLLMCMFTALERTQLSVAGSREGRARVPVCRGVATGSRGRRAQEGWWVYRSITSVAGESRARVPVCRGVATGSRGRRAQKEWRVHLSITLMCNNILFYFSFMTPKLIPVSISNNYSNTLYT